MHTPYSIAPSGDSAVVIAWEQHMDAAVHQQVMQAFYSLQALGSPFIRDLIPAYASLTVIFHTTLIRKEKQESAGSWITSFISAHLQQQTMAPERPARTLEVPVCYDPSLAPDLLPVAEHKGVTPEQVISWHTATVYTVYMLGFLPGFPYMGKLSDSLTTRRLKHPRLQVPAGSVGIAGHQTGIYPLVSPGGWNIIGKTPLKLFDPQLASPCYFQPGDQVIFTPISLETFHQLQQPT